MAGDTVMRAPRKVHLDITARCNLRCRYCYFFANEQVLYEDLPTAEWLTFIDEMGRAGVMEAIIAGGEPFIREDLPELLDALVAARMRFSLLSNGGLITPELAAKVAATGRCNFVQVSLDAARPELHDAARGRGSWEGAVRGLRVLGEAGVNRTVRVTIHRHNVDDLEAVATFLLEDLGLSGFGTNAAGYLGACRQHSDSLLLTSEQRTQAMRTLVKLTERYPGRIQAAAGPLAEARMWREMEQLRQAGAPQSARGGRLTACGCVHAELTVRSDGAYVACSMLPQMVVGRINVDPLLDVWQHAPALIAMRTRSTIPLSSFAECAACGWQPYCTGNCPGLAYSLTGQVDHPSPDACLRRYVAAGGQLV